MTRYLPTILALAVLIAGAVADPVSGFVAAHPTLALIITQLVAVLNHWLPSPRKPSVEL